MAWGLWNKIKQGFKKVGAAIKKGAQWVNEKVIKPFKPVISAVANKIKPGAGMVVEAVSDGIDAVATGDINTIANRAASMANNPQLLGAFRPYKKLN